MKNEMMEIIKVNFQQPKRTFIFSEKIDKGYPTFSKCYECWGRGNRWGKIELNELVDEMYKCSNCLGFGFIYTLYENKK